MDIVKGYMIYAQTGCSCCYGENHDRGPYKTRQEAELRRKNFLETSLLASQYSKNGIYTISEVEFEQLPDGRLIYDSKVYPGFFKVGGCGTIIEAPGDQYNDRCPE